MNCENSGGSEGVERQIAAAVRRTGQTVAAAESLTGGAVSAALSAIEGASDWFRGSVVAYSEDVKFQLLGVDRGPVITARAAQQMAAGVCELLGSAIAVATTGVGGPGPQEEQPEGTVYIAVCSPAGCTARRYHFDGGPADVVSRAKKQSLLDLCQAVQAV